MSDKPEEEPDARKEALKGIRDPETRTQDTPALSVAIPRRIGHYHIKRVIASGGMGTVYEAMQEHPRRTVAVKVLKHGIASRAAMRRFEYESQVLARLRHSGIAQVYEAGTHDDGTGSVPYFAMEYVPNAKPITEYAKEKTLNTRERLELFAHACDAVHHGHQKGIIHRDLKPGNILVDSHGNVKIIDFGVARGTDSDMAVTTLQTDIGQLVGTLQYMSPEQCEADPHDIDTRSDVYTLGMVLYLLLCGQLPYDVRKSPALGPRAICEEQPVPLHEHDGALGGDIETIVHKALEKDRERRYQSAVELAQDIRRYLAGDPIVARPPNLLYQLRLCVRRHKTAVGAFAAVAVALVGWIITSTALYVRSEAHRVRAERAVAIAEAVDEFLNNVLRSVAPGEGGPDITMREALDAASGKVGGEFADEPLVEASIRSTLAYSYWALGQYDTASPHAIRALELRRVHLGEVHRDTLDAMNTVGIVYKYRGRFDEAERVLTQALEARSRVLGDQDPDTLESMSNVAALFQSQDRVAEAEPLLRDVLATRQRELGREDPETLMSMASLASLLSAEGKLDEAEALARAAFETRRRVLGETDDDTVQSMYTLAVILANRGKPSDAEQLYRRALELARVVYGDEHPYVANILYGLGLLVQSTGDLHAAEPFLREALTIRCKRLGEDHWQTGKTRGALGVCLTQLGRYDEAERELLAAYHTLAAAKGKDAEVTQRAADQLAVLHEASGRPDEAAAWRTRPVVQRMGDPAASEDP